MKKSNNQTETRNLCKNLDEILGISSLMVKHFLLTVKDCLLHSVAEQALLCTEGKLTEVDIEVPYIGTLHVDLEHGKITSTSIVLVSDFANELEDAVNFGKSTLLERAETSMVENIKSNYDSLI